MPGEEDQRSSLLAGSDASDTKPDSLLPPAIFVRAIFSKKRRRPASASNNKGGQQRQPSDGSGRQSKSPSRCRVCHLPSPQRPADVVASELYPRILRLVMTRMCLLHRKTCPIRSPLIISCTKSAQEITSILNRVVKRVERVKKGFLVRQAPVNLLLQKNKKVLVPLVVRVSVVM